MGFYSKLREIGHGRLEAMRRAFSYRVGNSLPFPSYEPIELQIEEGISRLEEMLKPKYRPKGTEIDEGVKRQIIDQKVGWLNSQLKWDDKKRFSAAQLERYDTVLEQLAEIYSED